jgi:hypothetical protein
MYSFALSFSLNSILLLCVFVNHLRTITKSNAEDITQTTFSSGFYKDYLKAFFIQNFCTTAIFSTNFESNYMSGIASNGKYTGTRKNYLSTISKSGVIAELFDMQTFMPIIRDFKQSIKLYK